MRVGSETVAGARPEMRISLSGLCHQCLTHNINNWTGISREHTKMGKINVHTHGTLWSVIQLIKPRLMLPLHPKSHILSSSHCILRKPNLVRFESITQATCTFCSCYQFPESSWPLWSILSSTNSIRRYCRNLIHDVLYSKIKCCST